MPIEFKNKPLDWGIVGVEPSAEKKAQGFANGEAPAAGHWDYKFYCDYLVQKELQEKVKELSGQEIDPSTLVTKEDFVSHQADLAHVHWIGTATGTNTLKATYDTITEYKEGLAVSFKNTTASTAATTLNINGLGDIPIINSDGEAQTELKANGVYTVRYSNGNFILQGSSGSVSKALQVTSLTATVGFSTTGQVQLDWTFPTDAKRKGIRIMYKTDNYPTSPNDGTLFYDSNDATPVTTLTKTGFTDGTKYYFRAFTWTYKNATRIYTTDTNNAQTTATPLQIKGIQTFVSSQEWTIPPGVNKIDIFLVGGGSGGNNSDGRGTGAGGGSGGFTKTYTNVTTTPGSSISISVGSGGSGGITAGGGYGVAGGSSIVTVGSSSYIANGGALSSNYLVGNPGGSGGGGGGYERYTAAGNGGSNGSDGLKGNSAGGTGQQTSTRAFGETDGTLYTGGGGGASGIIGGASSVGYGIGGSGGGGNGGMAYASSAISPTSGVANSGGGGGGGNGKDGAPGGSGIVIIRWGY